MPSLSVLVQVRHVFYSGTRITIYESMRTKLASAGVGRSPAGEKLHAWT
jgi:hypothetical protein